MSKAGRGQTCAYCHRRLEARGARSRAAATRDHVIPQANGGTVTVWCCRQCNILKADRSPEAWAEFMTRNPEWWKRPEFRVPRRL